MTKVITKLLSEPLVPVTAAPPVLGIKIGMAQAARVEEMGGHGNSGPGSGLATLDQVLSIPGFSLSSFCKEQLLSVISRTCHEN